MRGKHYKTLNGENINKRKRHVFSIFCFLCYAVFNVIIDIFSCTNDEVVYVKVRFLFFPYILFSRPLSKLCFLCALCVSVFDFMCLPLARTEREVRAFRP